MCLNVLAQHSLPATFFVPGLVGRKLQLSGQLSRLLREGHQLACHGLYHDPREDYILDSLTSQVENLQSAKQLLEDTAGTQLTSFRAPAFRVSAKTYCALEKVGFQTDLSVCSQRLGLLSSQVGNYQWMLAPRKPYHPSPRNPYRRGSMNLLSIPFTSLGLPFMSALYHTIGFEMAIAFYRSVVLEALLFNRPIVFMSHPEEFCPYTTVERRDPIRWSDFIPGRTYGFPIRWYFHERSAFKIYVNNLRFLEFLATSERLEFLTVDEYVRKYHAIA